MDESGYRAFQRDFIEYMPANGWPTYRHAEEWFREALGFFKNAIYGEMRKGDRVPERYLVGFAQYMLALYAEEPDDHRFRIFTRYFEDNGWPLPETLSLMEIVERLCTPIYDSRTPTLHDDVVVQGPGRFAELFSRLISARTVIKRCSTASDVADAVRWMYVESGRAIANDPLLPQDQAEALAAKLNCVKYEKYVEQAIKWWKYSRWTIIHAKKGTQSVAMSMCLPLTKQAYESLLDGERMSYEFEPLKDFDTPPCNRILVKAMSIRPKDMGGNEGQGNLRMVLAGFAQAGALMFSKNRRAPDSLHILSFAGTPLNEKRLESYGFTKSRRKMRGTEFEFFELALGGNRADFHKRQLYFWLQMLGLSAKESEERQE